MHKCSRCALRVSLLLCSVSLSTEFSTVPLFSFAVDGHHGTTQSRTKTFLSLGPQHSAENIVSCNNVEEFCQERLINKKNDAQELDRLKTRERKETRRTELWSQVADPSKRAVATIRASIQFRQGEMNGRICDRCWVPLPDCVCCPADEPIYSRMPHRILIYLHHKEFGRFSNTGALLLSAFPNQTELIIAGLPEQEERLRGLLLEDPPSTMILWPHGMPLAAFLNRTILPAAAAGAGSSSGGGGGGGGGGGAGQHAATGGGAAAGGARACAHAPCARAPCAHAHMRAHVRTCARTCAGRVVAAPLDGRGRLSARARTAGVAGALGTRASASREAQGLLSLFDQYSDRDLTIVSMRFNQGGGAGGGQVDRSS